MLKPRISFNISVEGIVWHDGQYLTITRGPDVGHAAGLLAFPGGGVEFTGERVEDVLEENVMREVMEETGVQIEPQMHYLDSTAFIPTDGGPAVHITFLCRYRSGKAHVASLDEIAAVQWMTAEKILADDVAPFWIQDSVHLAEKKRRELSW
ncbi:MAG: NUDIX domain-containing protein [Chloroflexi bacterium]|nr:NUDIX domain-containing protein [Chloroflexota bacterium]